MFRLLGYSLLLVGKLRILNNNSLGLLYCNIALVSDYRSEISLHYTINSVILLLVVQ